MTQSYTLTADVSDLAGNAATQVTSSSFTVDTSLPGISAITTSAFSWGAVLNSVEDNSNGTVVVPTVGVEDGQTVTLTVNGTSYTASVSSDSATVTISAAGLQALTNGQSYTMTGDVSDAAGNAATQVISSSFTVDTSVPSISAIGTGDFSWGATLICTEDNSSGTVTVGSPRRRKRSDGDCNPKRCNLHGECIIQFRNRHYICHRPSSPDRRPVIHTYS